MVMSAPKVKPQDQTALLQKAVADKDLAGAAGALANGANPSARSQGGLSQLMIAARGANIEMCSLLLKSGACLDFRTASGEDALSYALAAKGSKKNIYEIIKLLFQKATPRQRADFVNEKHGYVLHLAISFGHGLKICDLIIRNGANVAATDNHGATVLHRLMREISRPTLLAFLIKEGAPLNTQIDASGNTALHYAIETRRNNHATRQLLEAGANTNITDAHGNSALHLAIFYGAPDTIKMLLAHGADLSLKNKAGCTAEETALAMQRSEMHDLLRQVRESKELNQAVSGAAINNRVRI
jgi:ankyrin repeat protein